jgi:hypothetical protein
MKKLSLIIITVTGWLAALGQSSLPMRIDTSRASVAYWNKWTNDLYDNGVDTKKDSFFVKEEVIRLLKDSTYRKEVYPAMYDWKGAAALLQKMELKRAFWQMINLYQADTKNKGIVVKICMRYDSLMEMDKILLSTFYTYAFADPKVCRMKNGKPEIYRPDLLEKGLRATKEITSYLWAYREQKAAIKK